MRKFNEKATCRKCGGKQIATRFKPAQEFCCIPDTLNGWRNRDPEHEKDRLRRTCLRCHFEWNEQPLEKEAK